MLRLSGFVDYGAFLSRTRLLEVQDSIEVLWIGHSVQPDLHLLGLEAGLGPNRGLHNYRIEVVLHYNTLMQLCFVLNLSIDAPKRMPVALSLGCFSTLIHKLVQLQEVAQLSDSVMPNGDIPTRCLGRLIKLPIQHMRDPQALIGCAGIL